MESEVGPEVESEVESEVEPVVEPREPVGTAVELSDYTESLRSSSTPLRVLFSQDFYGYEDYHFTR